MPSQTYYKIIKAAEAFLRAQGSASAETSKNNKQIVSHIRANIENGDIEVDVTDGTILSYLSGAANNDVDSCIVSGGAHGGYWLEEQPTDNSSEQIADTTEIEVGIGEQVDVAEKDLYPLVELWLQQKGYTSKDVSQLKKGGKWGNPDIVGAERIELFGAVEIELSSCEIKLSDDGWELVIFEAISHKRFSNRSWFCYRTSIENAPLPKSMEYYAERYRVGIVQIYLTDEELVSLKKSQKPLDFIDNVFERIPALYDHVPLREKSEMINRANVNVTLKF